jgi:quercetin 2,3-dioxygenase
LKSFLSSSFASYFDSDHVQFGSLRVINEDRIAANTGFGTRGRCDMEIVTYVLSGALGDKDSLGNFGSIPPGDVQRISAGTGIQHREFNDAKEQKAHFLQIWIMPNKLGVVPSYEQKRFLNKERRGKLRLLVSHNGAQDSLRMRADVEIYADLFDGAEQAKLQLGANQIGYVHAVRGTILINGQALSAGDALKLTDADEIHVQTVVQSEVLVFGLAAL